MSKRASGVQKAHDNVEAFERYLADLKQRGEPLPLRPNGDVNLSKVAKDSGIGDRGRFYTNDRLKDLLEGARPVVPPAEATVLAMQHPMESTDGSDALRRSERRAQRLEQHNATLVAENAELRRQLRELRLQLGREDMVIETGRRVPAPPEQ
ncbi:hypothetical protein ACQ858_09575 [Variovorax ureilyticus]|uniref:hypothetical protein n=1 Tax=Variovorax ureilyticus TaxID=1836198 RepID=UPI003D67B0CE